MFCWEGGLSRGQCEEEAGGGLGCGGLAWLHRAEAVRGVEDPPGEALGGAAFGRLRLAECFRRGIGFSFSRFTVAPLIPSALGMMDHRGPEVDKLDLRNLFPGFAARISRPERHPGTIPPATYRSPPGNPSRLGCPPRHSAFSNLDPPPPAELSWVPHRPKRQGSRGGRGFPRGPRESSTSSERPSAPWTSPRNPGVRHEDSIPSIARGGRRTAGAHRSSALYPDDRSALRLGCGRLPPPWPETDWDSGAIPTNWI